MQQHLVRMLFAASLAGCSLLYNPRDIPTQMDAPPPADAPSADVNPALLELDLVRSPVLLEGQGTSGSAPAILVIAGHHILQDAAITVDATTANANVMLSSGQQVVAANGDWIAVPVAAAVMMTVDDGVTIPLTVTVTQPGAEPKTIAWSLQALDQLVATSDVTIAVSHPRPYSKVDITGALILKGSTPESRGLIRSTGLLEISGAITAVTDLTPTTSAAVAGGCAGGQGGTEGGCAAPTAGGKGSGTAGGGGGGFDGSGTATTASMHGAAGSGTGDPLIRSYASNLGGGGGGGGGTVTGGGEGGATGGAVELTADGDLVIGAVTMNGVNGEDPPVAALGGGGAGGAGGVIIIRAKGTLVAGAVSAKGGTGGGSSGGLGGNGANGRIRFDTPTSAIPAGTTPIPHRGLMITPIVPPITRTKTPSITVTGTPNDTYDLYIINPDVTAATTLTGVTLTQASSTFVTPQLAAGHNTICVLPAGATLNATEAKNCIELALLP